MTPPKPEMRHAADERGHARAKQLLRITLWALIGCAAVSAVAAYYWPTPDSLDVSDYGGGEYALVDHFGRPFEASRLVGQPSLLFFGYTSCPDVCPITLGEMAGWFEELGDEAEALRAYLVTVDPQRDTAPVLADYLNWTDGRVTGVTGSAGELAEMMKAWRITAEKIPAEGGSYTIDHTASVFLVDADGHFRGTIAYLENWETAIAKLRRLVRGQW